MTTVFHVIYGIPFRSDGDHLLFKDHPGLIYIADKPVGFGVHLDSFDNINGIVNIEELNLKITEDNNKFSSYWCNLNSEQKIALIGIGVPILFLYPVEC